MNVKSVERVLRALSIVERDYVTLTFVDGALNGSQGLVRLQCGRLVCSGPELADVVEWARQKLPPRIMDAAGKKQEVLADLNQALQLLNAAERDP